MSVFKRMFKVGQAEAHAMVDKLEDPVKMTEQGIRDMKKDLDKSLQALAEVKALAIRTKKEANDYKSQADMMEKKAMALLQKAEKGDIDPAEADRLASEALLRKEENMKNAANAQQQLQQFDGNIAKLDSQVKKLRSMISQYEGELKTLKARARVSEATKKINKSMSNIDSSSTVNMLERMKEKVSQQEAMAEAYGDIADGNKSIDDEINDALADDPSVKASDQLAALKAKMKGNS